MSIQLMPSPAPQVPDSSAPKLSLISVQSAPELLAVMDADDAGITGEASCKV